MNDAADFSLAVVSNACDGPRALRERLVESGLDVATVARLVNCSPLAIARATKTGSAPRGLLIGLAVLATVVDRLHQHGVAIADLAQGGENVDAALADVADESPLAARMLARLGDTRELTTHPTQLSFDLHRRIAA